MKYVKYACLLIFFITGALTLLNTFFWLTGKTHFIAIDPAVIHEKYDEKYLDLTSVDKVVEFCDAQYRQEKNEEPLKDTLAYLDLLSDVLKKRFCHGLAQYNLTDSWLIYLESLVVWDHLSAIVNPNEILKHNIGLCSQQQLVFMSVLKAKSIPFRYVGLGRPEGPGHFVSEVFYDHRWHMSDVTFEPDWSITGNQRIEVDSLRKNPALYFDLYKKTHSREVLSILIGQVSYGEKNLIPGNKMSWFHTVNFILIYLVPLLSLYLYRKIKI